MNAKTLLTFLVLSAAVAGSWYLARQVPKEDALAEKGDEPTRGFYLSEAVIYGTGEDGKTRYTLRAERIEQRIKEGGFALQRINLTLDDPDGTPWQVMALEGSIPELLSRLEQAQLSDATAEARVKRYGTWFLVCLIFGLVGWLPLAFVGVFLDTTAPVCSLVWSLW